MIKRKQFNYINQKYTVPKTFVVKSSTSISGVPHIGNAADVIRHDAAVRALKDRGKKVKYIWVGEDMDALRKVPAGIPKHYKKYLGMPVADLPCPDGCCDNYSEHFCTLFVESLRKEFGTNPTFISTAKTYRKGVFHKDIKKIMANVAEVRSILDQYRKEPLPKDWNPWKPVCDECGKLMTTQVIGEPNAESVEYQCKDFSFQKFGSDSAYTDLKGCGHHGQSDLKKGNGKLLWRVEWAMLWNTWKVHLEGAGKEHYMPGGSFWTAGEIAEKILGFAEPYPGKNPIQPYEYITVGGAKMSASVGNTVATWEWPKFAPAEVLRLLFMKKPTKQRDFTYEGIFSVVDELDRFEKIYFGKEKVENKKELEDTKRLFAMSMVEMPKKYRAPISFTFLASLSAIHKEFKDVEKILKDLGHPIIDRAFTKKRFEQASRWFELYAPERMKYTVQDKSNVKLDATQQQAVKELVTLLNKKTLTEKQLFGSFRDICEQVNIQPKTFFQTIYTILINKQQGPKLAPLILAIGQKKAAAILKKTL
ncbi:lysine--tRNA ligase [archaeon]|nr:lysine--tRNA ligase [archaeon]